MTSAAWVIIGVFVLAAFAIIVVEATLAWRRYAGRRIVTCPETEREVYVDIDAKSAAIPVALGWPPDYRLVFCSRWPERLYCGQECIHQIAAAPDETLVRTIENRWYGGKSCSMCGSTFDVIDWRRKPPALLSPEKARVWWKDVAPERISDTLITHEPICGACAARETTQRSAAAGRRQ